MDILDKLKDWKARLAEMDRGEFDNGIMTSIRFEQRDTLAKAMAEIARLRQASKETAVPAWNPPENLPGTRAIFLVRKWVSKSGAGAISFVAKDPDEHLRAFGFVAEFDPDVAVVVGFVCNGAFHDENGFVDESFDLSATLAWMPIPPEYLREGEAAAQKASELLARVTW